VPQEGRQEALHCRAEGSGQPILFLHGIPDSGRAWDGVIARLSGHYRCLAPDLPGFGASAPAEKLKSLSDCCQVMEALVAQLALPERLSLVVHDIGTVFGLAWAARNRKRIHRLVILNASIFPDRRWHWGARIFRLPLLGEALVHILPRRAFHAEMRRASSYNLSNAAIDETWREFGLKARGTALRLYRLQWPHLFGALPEQVRTLAAEVPTLVIWGARDPYLPVECAYRFGARAVHIHSDLGHWPHKEAPDRIAAEIRAFLTADS
jgi:pimeloyl-ACP methyl ester carboxylesterase